MLGPLFETVPSADIYPSLEHRPVIVKGNASTVWWVIFIGANFHEKSDKAPRINFCSCMQPTNPLSHTSTWYYANGKIDDVIDGFLPFIHACSMLFSPSLFTLQGHSEKQLGRAEASPPFSLMFTLLVQSQTGWPTLLKVCCGKH